MHRTGNGEAGGSSWGRWCMTAMLVVVLFASGGTRSARAEVLKVAKDGYMCNASGLVASSTGVSSFTVEPWASFNVDVTEAANIVSISLDWGEGGKGTMCLVWCQLFVNGVKHTNGAMTTRAGTRGPFYSFAGINSGNKKGIQELWCIYDPAGDHVPVRPGEYPLP